MKNSETKVYIIYRFDAKATLDTRLDYIKGGNNNIVFFTFRDSDDKNWKKKADKKMHDCDFAILFYDNEYFSNDSPTPNVEYELGLVKKYRRKLITIYTSSKEELDGVSEAIKNNRVESFYKNSSQKIDSKKIELLFGYDFSERNFDKENFKPLNIVEGKERVLEYSDWSIDDSLETKTLVINKNTDVDMKKEYYDLLMEQYKIMIETSENLMKRRSEMSDKYRTICIALMSLVSATLVFGNLLVTGILMAFAGSFTMFLSRPWRSALKEFSKNNEGKFAVINAIEKKLPANMFDSEYTFNTFKGIRIYSVRELSFPKIFKWLGFVYIIIGCIFIALVVTNALLPESMRITKFFDLFKPRQ